MTRGSRTTLLGRLAREGWFTQMGEPAATKCVALMAQDDERLHAATLRWLGELTGVDLSAVRLFVPERVHDDGARPDMEGLDSAGRPLVVVEAKFGAELTEGQLAAYLLDQQARLAGDAGVLVALMPDSRLDHAADLLTSAVKAMQSTTIATVAVSWDAWLDNWDAVLVNESPDDFGLRSDLHQLRGMVRTLGGLLGQPYAPNAEAPWREWETDLATLVSEFTREVNEDDGYTAAGLPIQSRDPAFSPARYVVAAHRDSKNVFLLVGLSSQRADLGETPIWARLAHNDAAPVLSRLRPLFPDGEEDAYGQFWIPLTLPNTVGRERVHFMANELRALKAKLATVL